MRSVETSARWLWAIFLVALLLRTGYAGSLGSANLSLSSDAQAYDSLAVNLVTRHQFITTIDPPHRWDVPYATRPPLTPGLLAATYLVAPRSPRVAQVAMAVVSAASCVLLVLLGTELFEKRVGITAGFLAAVNPFFVFLASIPLTENLAILLYIALGMLLVRLARTLQSRDAVAAGAVFGLAILNKPAGLGALPLVVAWLIVSERANLTRGVALAALFAAAAAIVVTPWTLRNYARLGALVPITNQGGGVMYQANGFHADYAIERLEQGATGWYNLPGRPDAFGQDAVAADRRQARAVMAFIRRHPGKFAEQALRKIRIFWGAYPSAIHSVSWALLAALSVAGAYLTRARWRRLMPLYLLIAQTASIPILFTAMPRFRAPIEPFLIIFAAVPLVSIWTRAAASERP